MAQLNPVDLQSWSKDDLIQKVIQQQAHIKNLQNVLVKGQQQTDTQRKKKNRKFDFNKYNTRHVALRFLYLGWDYLGYVTQEETTKTIEHQLFDALIKTRLIESRDTSNYHRCGRTDKGVSAFSQVISIDLRTNLLEGKGVKQREGGTAHTRGGVMSSEIDYCMMLNRVLPPEIRMLSWAPVEPDFSARFSCIRRTYKYLIPAANLNVDALRESCRLLEGEHDFRNFCKMDVQNGVVNFIRHIYSVSVRQLNDVISPTDRQTYRQTDSYELLELTVSGSGFLWHQIRCIVAVLLLVGQELEEPRVISELLDVEKHPRKPQYTMASELPLNLYDVEYPDIEWRSDPEELSSVVRHLQTQWTTHSVRCGMIRRMLFDLETQLCRIMKPVYGQAECLQSGDKPRVYKPLLSRQVCESLEERVEHCIKRQRLNPDVERKLVEFSLNVQKHAGDQSKQLPGDQSKQLSGDQSKQLSGDQSKQLSGDLSKQLSGDQSRQLSDDRSNSC